MPIFHQSLNSDSQFSFDLSKPISIKEAIFGLDYSDHDFYVFRDEETNEVSVVYKRNAGGVGLIQPEQ
jgi:putative sigma-54 modulation protein